MAIPLNLGDTKCVAYQRGQLEARIGHRLSDNPYTKAPHRKSWARGFAAYHNLGGNPVTS